MTVEQFKKNLLGDAPEKEKHGKQLYQIMQEESQAARTAGTFLTRAELARFGEFRTNAMNISRWL
ncbi:MAG: hypothetical protein ABJC04_00810 [Verrucomicrobiota bacterium]